MVSEPTVTALATEEPEIMPNSAEPKIDTLAGPPAKRPATADGDVDEQPAQADARGEHAEQHEVEDVGRHHADRDAVDALAGEVEVVDELRARSCRGA